MALRRGSLACSEPDCASQGAVACSYVDRRQRQCTSAWCHQHQQIAFNAIYCRRHAGIIAALGPDHVSVPLPDLENRAPSLANWVGRDLDGPIRDLLEREYPGTRLHVTAVVSGGSWRDRVWSRSWKLISDTGVDLWINISVAEAEDSSIRLVFEQRTIAELTPPWIEARRHGVTVDRQTDTEARRRFYALILEDIETAIAEHKSAAANRYRVVDR
jgi:hypothetical protein